ncbi:hypothetical protein WK60_13885 [Burkholderia ubonensis]|uniref:hypothetical protein n=1 Tax=Burkholderia ubonensis TaxID=101571 RepID=UPI00075A6E16|nr:hypothetical protein [Burkholderia ubonensis]KVT92676.1 hypothetical protein WK60_13885 [Burkholderia ubonensis]
MSLPDLSQAVETAFANVVASGAIEKAIEANLEATITSILKDQLKSYGDFGKQLTEKVNAAMQIDLDRMDLPTYGHFIEKVIARAVDAQLQGDVAKKIEAHMTALLADAPQEMTLEQIVADFKVHVKDRAYGGDVDHSISLHVTQTGYGYWHIAMDKDSGTDEYRCSFRIGINDAGEIYSLRIADEDVNKELFIRPAKGFERNLYRMFVSGTKIKIEPDTTAYDFDLSMYED